MAAQTIYRFTCDRCKARFESTSQGTLSRNVWFGGTRVPNRGTDLPTVLEEPVF